MPFLSGVHLIESAWQAQEGDNRVEAIAGLHVRHHERAAFAHHAAASRAITSSEAPT